jgi:hypothetical protein
MVNKPKKTNKTLTNTINSILPDNKPQPKSRQQIYSENYQKNKERKRVQQKERYLQKKQCEQEQLNKYYQAINIKVLLSFKEYISLNKDKHKLWLDFNRTLKDIKEEIHDIVAIMKLRESADNLIRDYWETAKGEVKKGKNWNSLSEEQQQRLIRYWGYEKARIENNFLTTAEQLEKQSQSYLKELELAKYHEERGKIKCPCYQCQESKQIQGKIKEQLFKEDKTEKEQCPECKKWVKELDEEAGVCKSCKRKYE